MCARVVHCACPCPRLSPLLERRACMMCLRGMLAWPQVDRVHGLVVAALQDLYDRWVGRFRASAWRL